MRLLRASFALLVLCAGGRALADPACGDTVTSNVSLSADIVCPTGFTNWALRIGAPNITIEGNGKRIVAPTGYGVLGQNMNGVTVRNLDVSGNTNVDGVSITGDDVTLSGITATGRNYGVTVSGRNPTVRDCRITGAGYAVSVAGLGATIVNNDLQRNSNGVYLNNYSGALTFSGNNVTGSSIGLRLGTVTGTLSLIHI